ncbi:HNH endonuclease [Salmonella enterica]|uniref:HNH endonuclease n=1 Tax=Salmonella enterica TaxID=28901 RepID=UPI002159D156|nr:HNH endonuclease signature motif containing protein [Salmonella enterica]
MAKYKVNVQDINVVLNALGGESNVNDIKDKIISDFCSNSIPDNYSSERTFSQTIQRIIEDHCPDSANFDSSKRVARFSKVGRGAYKVIDRENTWDDNDEEFFNQVKKSLSDSPSIRRQRLLVAKKTANKVKVFKEVFERNSDVIAEVLFRAGGFCENCKLPAPFFRRVDSSPYLEVHHKIRLADGGDDTVENAIAVCPNCHRKLHFGV